MDFQKTKNYLDKLQREYARLSKDPENVVRLDVDIMASYVRELYDAILSEPQEAVVKSAPEPPARKPVVLPPPVEPAPAPPPPPPAPVAVEPPAPVVIPEPVAPPAPPVAAPEPVVAPPPPPPPPPAPAPVAAAEPKSAPAGLEVLFEEKQAKELSEKLAETPIADLKKAIALNDRLLYTNELFASDGKAFEEALGMLNSASSYDAAQAYLVEHCAVRYAWTDKKRLDTAKAFVKLVRRRHK